MNKVIIFTNGITRVIRAGKIIKEHFTTESDRQYYTKQGLKVEAREYKGRRG